MCGIFAIVSKQGSVKNLILSALKKLEYRGYDSAGIAILNSKHALEIVKVSGKVDELIAKLKSNQTNSNIGIGHTRWATHGVPNSINAHPHATDLVAVVHNGIIENFQQVKMQLELNGKKFISDTDTEVIPQLISSFLEQGQKPIAAIIETVKMLRGAFSIAVIFHNEPDLLIVAKKGSPLVLGVGENQNIASSDTLALSNLTEKVIFLQEGDIASLTSSKIEIFNENGQKIDRKIEEIKINELSSEKGPYAHFMLKEIYEQPIAVSRNISYYYDHNTATIKIDGKIIEAIASAPAINIIACGTSFYAAQIAKYWLESIAGITVNIDVASEFRYRNPVLKSDGVAVFISQSGETADTVEALRMAKKSKQYTLAIVNTANSTMQREADWWLPIMAGPEIGVASTKAFTCQLMTLAYLVIGVASSNNCLSSEQRTEFLSVLRELPHRIDALLEVSGHIQDIAQCLVEFKHIIYIGRNLSLPIALEGALKLKELSYIHAEAFPAGELKHGPIALIDNNMPVIIIAPDDKVLEKTLSNAQEIKARGGKIVVFTSRKGAELFTKIAWQTFVLEDVNNFIMPMMFTIPLQLLAYYIALAKANDIDQPRNLAKSVTVE